jgi:sulfhydrogenase subunit beta (sulfur reductase)
MREAGYLARGQLADLLDLLDAEGFDIVGPVVRDGAIQYRPLTAADDLPQGWVDKQGPGHYRLNRTDSPRCFAWAVGPQALKPFLFPPAEPLWQARRDGDGGLAFAPCTPAQARPLAILGVRACDIAALYLQDRHFLDHGSDAAYAARRRDLLLVAVHCTAPAATCFCASTGDGPGVTDGADLALHELDDGFIVACGSGRGDALAERLPLRPCRDGQRDAADAALDAAARRQARRLPAGSLEATLFERLEHPRWDDLAGRCLACGNCTSVCPTCFCHRERDESTLDGSESLHLREWDSCFSAGHAHLGGYQLRPGIRFRYRQWLTHKLGSWHSQYGRSGCVGCGRCITWCPVGIDITEEARALCDGAPAR